MHDSLDDTDQRGGDEVASRDGDSARLPVVLIHGLVGALDDERILNALAPRQAIAPDLLGYGRNAGFPGRIDLDAQTDALRRVLDRGGLRRVHLAGHSVGGAIAMLFASEDPSRVASIVNIEGNFSLADAFWSANFARLPPEEAARTPVHLVCGERSRDAWDVPDWALDAAASFTTLPGGHLMMADDPERFAHTIEALVSPRSDS